MSDGHVFTTELEDDSGELHEYSTVPFGYDEGMKILAEATEVFGGSLGGVVGGLVAGWHRGDGEAIAAAMSNPAKLLMEKGGGEFVGRILQQTKRQYTSGGQEKWGQLKESKERTRAYARNYGESMRAVKWVLEVNFGPFGKMITRSFGGSLTDTLRSFGISTENPSGLAKKLLDLVEKQTAEPPNDSD